MKKLNAKIVTALSCASLLATCAHAQDAKTTNAPAKAEPSKTNALPSAARNIRFQFDGIPYNDVLERFAQMSGKPLLASTNIQGTLTYNDPKPYSYGEALDILNLMLSMKNMMLVDSGSHLQLVPFRELPQMPLKIIRGADATGDVRPGEVVTVVLDLKSLDAKEVADSLVPMLSNAGSVAPLSRGRGLILTDRLQNIQRIKYLLAQIDTESTAQRQMKTFTLLHSSGAVVADLINRTFGVATAPKRTSYNPNSKQLDVLPPDPADYVTAVFDDASRTLVLFGPRERIGLAEDLISRFEDKEGPHAGDVRIYFPQTIRADELATMVRQAIPGVAAPNETGTAAALKARLIADASQNRLIVSAPVAGQLDEIERLINKVDKPIHGTGQFSATRSQTVHITKVFRPRAAEPAAVAKILSEALSRRSTTGVILPTANVSVEPGSQTVVVTGSPADVQTAIDIITQLETGSTMPVPQQTKFIDVGTVAEAKRLLPLVEQIYRSQVTDSLSGQVAHARIIADAEAGRLIVTASDDHLKRIQSIVDQLRTSQPKREMAVLPVQSKSASELITVVSELMAQLGEDQANPQLAAKLIPDTSGKQIIALATAKDLERIRGLVQQLDTATAVAAARQFKAVDLFSRTASELAPLVQQLYSEQLKGSPEPAGGPATLIADAKNNRVMVSGSEKEIARAEAIIRQLDPAEKRAAKEETRVIRLKTGSATELAGLVEKSVNAQAQQVRVLVDARSNSLVVNGEPGAVEAASQIISQLDTRSDMGPREMRIIDLRSGDASTLAPMVTTLFTDMTRDQRGPDYVAQTKIVPDAASNRLIITGSRDEINQISKLVEQLDQTPEQSGSARVFKLQMASATTLAPIVSNAMVRFDARGQALRKVTVSADDKSNSLIVTGGRADVQDAAVIISRLDGDSDGAFQEEARELKIIPVNTTNPDQLAALTLRVFAAQNLGRNITNILSITPEPSGKRLIVLAPRTLLPQVEQVVSSLDQTRPTRETKVFDVGRLADAQRLLPLAQQLYRDQFGANAAGEAQFVSDGKTGRIIVSARPDHLNSIDEMFARLRTTSPADQAPRETRSFEIGAAADVQRVLPLVQQLYQDQWRDKLETDPADAQIVGDARSGRIIVSGKPEHIKQIDAIITQLGVSKARPVTEARDTRVYDLTTANATDLATTVRTLYTEQAKLRLGTLPPDTLILSDASANRLIVSGETSELTALEEIIQKLDKVSGQSASTRVFKLNTAAPAQVASLLSTALIKTDAYGRQIPRVSVGADDRNSMLVVSGEPKDIQAAAVIIEQMDAATTQEQRHMRIIPLKSGLATDVSTRLRQIYMDQVKGQGKGGTPDALILGDDASGRLIITASESHLKLLDDLIKQLDETGEGSARQLRVISLQQQSASSVAAMISQLFSRQTRDPSQRLTVTASPDDRTLIVDAAGRTFEEVEQLVKTLDKAMGDTQNVVQTVQLKKAQAEGLAEAVNKSIVSRGLQGRLQKVSVTGVQGANSLLINGPSDAVQEVMKIVRELDTESEDGEIKVRIYKLENGNVREVQGVLNQVLQGVTVAERRRTGRGFANLSTDERSNTLIISGSEAHFKVVEQLLKTLDRTPERSDRDVQFVFLKNARAVDVATKIEGVFAERPQAERPVIEADTFGNSITIIGRRPDVIQAQDLIARLDETSKDNSIQVRLRPIDRLPAEQMARMLQNIYPQMSIGRLKVVEKLPQPLKTSATLGNTNTAAPNLNPAPAPSTAAATNQQEALQPEVIIAVDKDANALILSGPANELDQIERIVSELSFSFISNDAEFRLVSLKEADPIVVARTINQLFRIEEPAPQPQQQQQQQQPPRPVREPRIAVVAEPRTRSVIVRAKPADFSLVENLIKQLDASQISAQLEFRTVPVTNATPAKVLPLVDQMVTQLRLARPGDPLSVAVDSRSSGILIVARGPVMEQVEKMIRSLDTPSAYSEAEVLVVALKKANATQLAGILQNMLKPGAQGELTTEARELQEQIRRLKIQGDDGQTVSLDLTKPIKIMSDPVAGAQGGNRLLLTSTPDNLKALAAVVGMMDNVAISEGVDVKIVRLERADAEAVAQTLSSIFSQGQRLATGPGGRVEPEGTGKALVNPLNVALDPRNNAVILSGRKESLELAEKIINDLDRELERFITEVKLFKLKFASATRLLPLLQAVFAEGPAVPGSAGLQQQVTRLRTALDGTPSRTTDQPKSRAALVMQADDSANVIIAAARADVLPLIEDVIKQLDIPAASGLSTVRLFPLKHADPQLVQRIINDLYAGARANQVRNEDKPTITIDDRTSTLIVASTERTFAIIESLLGNLDKELPLELRDVRILPLNHADAVELASQLQRLLDARVTQKTAVGKTQAEALRVLIIGEPRSNSLLIGGSNDSFELVQTLASQLDKPPSAVSGKIRQLPLQYADARNVATALNSLFTQRYQSAKSPEVQRNKPIIVPDPRGNSLLIGAGMDDNQMIDELLLKLDKKLDDPNLQIGVLALKHNDSGRVASTLENIFTARLQSRTPPGEQPSPQDRVKIEIDPLNNALVVSANRENLELIQGLLQKLDIEPSVLGGVVTTFTLQFADAQRVATILRTLVDQGLYRPGAIVTAGTSAKAAGGRDALAISVDPRSNTLIVSASPENLAIVRTVIAQVDTKDFAESGNVRLYTLKNARASTLAPTLEQFFRARRQGESASVNAPERATPITIVPDDRSNTLLVTGTKEGFEVIERLLQQLDSEDVRARMTFRIFPLKMATASKLQETLRQLFANRPPRVKGEPSEPISVVADSWVNALIIGASIEDMSAVASIIERLDSEQGGPGLAVQVFPLAKADARRIAQTVQSLYREGTSGAGGVGQAVTVSADERINAIVVSAGEADVKRIAELIKKLDTDQVARVAEIRVFALRYARAETLASILNTSLNTKPAALSEQSPNAQSVLQFIARNSNGRELVTSALKEGVLITPDSRVNSLIVSAPVDYMGLLEQIITKLDNSSHQKAKIKVFALQNADARQTAEVLAGLFRLAQAAAPGQNSMQRSIQYTLVKTVAAGSNGEALSESEIASAVLGTDEQSALNVTIDPRTNSLLIGGTEDYVSLVSEIIDALDSSEAQERKTEVYRLRNAQAQEVATAIRTFLDQERQRVSQVLGTEAVGTAQRLLEREIAVVAEPVSNTLLLSASPRYFDSIRNLIKELDTPQQQVLIQVLVAEVSLDNALDLGLEWTYNGVPFAAGIEISEAKWIESGFSSAVTGGDYRFLFRALEDKGRLEVLSRPQIVTADNKPAAINIGQTIPLITDSRVTERGDTINSFKYENVGVNLSVTPRISPDGFVKLDVYTTNSTISSSTVRVNANADVPIINQRIANTTVSVQSGQSILIGGLIGTLDEKRLRKVPFLGDIPVIGYLFRSNRNRQERRELLILLTPQVLTKSELPPKMLDPRDMTDDQLRKSRIKDEIKRDEVQKQILDPVFPPDQKFQPKGQPEPKPEDLSPNPR